MKAACFSPVNGIDNMSKGTRLDSHCATKPNFVKSISSSPHMAIELAAKPAS
jgi:hypothetical protein